MSWRARLYLAIAIGLYGICMGLACLNYQDRFTSVSFTVLKHHMPYGMVGWGWSHLIVGCVGVYAALRGREGPARFALVAVAMLLAPWVHGLASAFVSEPTAPPTGVIGYGTLMCVHLIMLRYPLRTPFQDLLKAVRNEEK
jgi:hypothetical protein